VPEVLDFWKPQWPSSKKSTNSENYAVDEFWSDTCSPATTKVFFYGFWSLSFPVSPTTGLYPHVPISLSATPSSASTLTFYLMLTPPCKGFRSPFSLPLSPTLPNFPFYLTFSLHVCFSFAKMNLQHKLPSMWPWVQFHLKKVKIKEKKGVTPPMSKMSSNFMFEYHFRSFYSAHWLCCHLPFSYFIFFFFGFIQAWVSSIRVFPIILIFVYVLSTELAFLHLLPNFLINLYGIARTHSIAKSMDASKENRLPSSDLQGWFLPYPFFSF